ncbi:hypothetical protein V866_003542 [Kwoniella sp. B9012]
MLVPQLTVLLLPQSFLLFVWARPDSPRVLRRDGNHDPWMSSNFYEELRGSKVANSTGYDQINWLQSHFVNKTLEGARSSAGYTLHDATTGYELTTPMALLLATESNLAIVFWALDGKLQHLPTTEGRNESAKGIGFVGRSLNWLPITENHKRDDCGSYCNPDAPDAIYYGQDFYGDADQFVEIDDYFGGEYAISNGLAEAAGYLSNAAGGSGWWDLCVCFQTSNTWVSTGSIQMPWDNGVNNDYGQYWQSDCGAG